MTNDNRRDGPNTASVGSDPQYEDDPLLQDIGDLLWEAHQGAPPLHEDPTAAMLGLVPDPSYALDPAKLKRARKRAGLQVTDLVARLVARGWSVSKADIFSWENHSTVEVSPALIKALAEEVDSDPDRLITKQSREMPSAIVGAVQSSVFESLVIRWARVQNVSRDLAASELRSRMLATAYRGDEADSDQMIQSLEILVSATEAAKESRRGS